LKEAGIPRTLAPTIGISVDHRRQNTSTESLTLNVARLKAYKTRLILFPRKSGQHKTLDGSKEDVSSAKKSHQSNDGKISHSIKAVMAVENVKMSEAIGEVKKGEMPESKGAYRQLRDARSEARYVGMREKRAKAKAEEAAAQKK